MGNIVFYINDYLQSTQTVMFYELLNKETAHSIQLYWSVFKVANIISTAIVIFLLKKFRKEREEFERLKRESQQEDT